MLIVVFGQFVSLFYSTGLSKSQVSSLIKYAQAGAQSGTRGGWQLAIRRRISVGERMRGRVSTGGERQAGLRGTGRIQV